MLDHINLLSNYALEHLEKGNLEEAEFLLLGSLSIVDGMYGIESPQYATILSNYCYLLYLDNRIKEAIEYGENAKLIFENNRLVNNSEYFACLNHLGALYDSIGLHDKALQIYEIVLTKVIKKENSLDLIQVSSNIGSQLIKRQKYESAVKYLQYACKIMENQKEVDKSNYPLILNTLGLALNGLNKSKKAIKICQKARRVMIKSKRTNSPYYYSILNNLALSYSLNREYKKALQIYASLLLCNENLSLNQISTINSNISGVYFFLGNYNESLQYAYASSKNLETFLNDYIGFIPDQYVNQFVASYHLTIDVIYSIVFSLKEITISDLIKSYNYILNRKSILYNIDVQRRRFEIMVENEKDQEIINELSILKSERLLKQYSNPDLFDPQSFIYQLDQKCAKIKRILFQKYPLFVNTDEEEETDYYLIREKLPENSVLLDYIWYKHVNKKSKKLEGSRYAVYVINSQKDIELIELGSADEIDNLINRVNSEDIYNNSLSDLNILGTFLLNPISHILNDFSHLIICPDGMLNQLSFEMVRREEKYLISDYTVSYLISSKDLLNNNPDSCKKSSSPIIIANPDYNLTGKILSTCESSKTKIHSNFETELYSELEYSEEEGKTIQNIIGGQLITNDAVSIQSFLSINSPKILHIATHGNFWPISKNTHEIWDSLMRSVLILAGRNAVLLGKSLPKCYGAGLVSAWEISNMNLISTELVVLSACESGLGDTLFSEGIFGLHRGFFIAGAKTLIASLWETDDNATKELMIYFYTFLKEGRGKAEALREAKLKIMQEYHLLYFWGSFRIFGDYGPIIS